MSRQINNKKSVEQKKFCKVCLDAGKSETEYTSHFVRASPEPGSKIVCPTLLAAECGYCHEIGHTPSCCKSLKAHQKAKRQEEQKEAPKPAPEKKTQKKQVARGFAALMEDSDDEQEVKKVEKLPSKSSLSMPKMQSVSPMQYNSSFPTLPSKAATATPATSQTKPAGKPQFMTAIEQSCPGLKVATKMPEVNTYRAPAAKLVRVHRLTPQEEEDKFINEYIEKHLKNDKQYQKEQKELNKQLASMAKSHGSHYGEDDLAYDQQMVCNSSGYDVTELYEEAYQAYIDSKKASIKKASELDWAALDSDSDSDDEDW